MVFHWRDSTPLQVSRTLLSILADLNNAISLDRVCSSSDFQIFQHLYQDLGDRSECTIYKWYHRHFYVP